MGYEIHIERENNKITLAEWNNFIEQSNEFKKVDKLEANNPITGEKIVLESPNTGIWEIKGLKIPFTFSEKWGWISVKNPEQFIIKKIVEMSKIFNGKVIGEEGEEYNG
ncbi:MAG: hypothetical protein P1U44_01520 [Vicingaceae bacterium]|nr:hypothetical protein [Vicingaceae bacterium]